MDANTTVVDALNQVTVGDISTALDIGIIIGLTVIVVFFIVALFSSPRF